MSTPQIYQTSFQFPDQTGFYRGKVRDVYQVKNKFMVMILTDRISAYDRVFLQTIRQKGRKLNEISNYFFGQTSDICKNWVIISPHPNVVIGYIRNPLPYEFIVRGYMDGFLWSKYQQGYRRYWNVHLPDDLQLGSKLPELILSPTTKSKSGKDVPITYTRIFSEDFLKPKGFYELRDKSFELFNRASEIYSSKGLILADTKFEFASDGTLIDEIFTPDSSRLYAKHHHQKRVEGGLPLKRYSKEVFREALINQGFDPSKPINQTNPLPAISDSNQNIISKNYQKVYRALLGYSPSPIEYQESFLGDIYQKTCEALKQL